MARLATDIITAAKRRIAIPTNQVGYLPADLLAMLQETLDEVVWPELLGVREDFLIYEQILPLTDSNGTLYPTNIIPIPTRAYGRKLRELKWLDPSDNLFNIPLVPYDDKDLILRNPQFTTVQRPASGFYIINDSFYILGQASTFSGSLVLAYPIKPPTLSISTTISAPVTKVTSSTVGAVTTSTFTYANLPYTDFETAVPAAAAVSRIDIFRKSTGGPIALDIKVTRTGQVVTTTDIDPDKMAEIQRFQDGGFDATLGTLTAGFAADIYMCPSGTCNYAWIPPEMDVICTIALAMKYAEAQGDTEGLGVLEAYKVKALQELKKILGQRMDGETKKIANRRGIRAYSLGAWSRGW